MDGYFDSINNVIQAIYLLKFSFFLAAVFILDKSSSTVQLWWWSIRRYCQGTSEAEALPRFGNF